MRKNRLFSPGLRSLHPCTATCLASFLHWSAVVNSRVLHTQFITLESETLLILFWSHFGFAWYLCFICSLATGPQTEESFLFDGILYCLGA